jgi:hypothetical protein
LHPNSEGKFDPQIGGWVKEDPLRDKLFYWHKVLTGVISINYES